MSALAELQLVGRWALESEDWSSGFSPETLDDVLRHIAGLLIGAGA